jgi:hypothetical protein
MNRKQLVILLILVAVVGAAGLRLRKSQTTSWESPDAKMGQKLLGDLPVNDIANVSFQQGTNELHLVKKSDLWCVSERKDYPANFTELRDFLNKIRDLKILQSEKVGASQLPRLALAPGSGTNSALVVDFKDQNGKALPSLLLGKAHLKKSTRPSPMGDEDWPDGRWVKVGADSDTAALISDALSNIEPKPEAWLDKEFFKVDKVRSISVAFPVATNSWKVSRETESGEWKLADARAGEQLDTSKTSGLASALGSPSFNDVDTTSKPEQLGLDQPTVVTLDTFDNFTYTVKLGQKTNDAFPLTLAVTAQLPKERTPGKDEKPEDKAKLDKAFKDTQKTLEEKLAREKGYENWVYLVSSWSVDSVVKDRGQLLVEKKEEPKKEDQPAAAPAPPTAVQPATNSAGPAGSADTK